MKASKKLKQEPFTKKKNEEAETKRVLDNLRMPKVQEIFTTYNYHSMSSLYERLADNLQNLFAIIILLWVSEGINKLFRETV